MKDMLLLNLQLFADGGAASGASTGGEAGTASGEGAQAAAVQPRATREERAKAALERQDKFLAEGQAAAGQEEPTEPTQPIETFDDLIKGKYKQDFDKVTQGIVKDRLKNSKQAEASLAALSPALARLAAKYGVDPADHAALAEKVLSDDNQYEEEALSKGLPVETVKELDRMKRMEEQVKGEREQQARELRIQERYHELSMELPGMKELYPSFNMQQELDNPKFSYLVDPDARVKYSLEDAYMTVHGKEILMAGMKYADDKGAQKVSRSIQANARRPSENGMGSMGPSQSQQRSLQDMTEAEKHNELQRIRKEVKEKGTFQF